MPFVSYSDSATITNLVVNVKSAITASMMKTFQAVVDGRIDSQLTAVFINWLSIRQGNLAVPEQVVACASLLTAAMIEKTKFALNEAGQAQPNPYAMDLENQGMEMLAAMKNADSLVPGLQRFTPGIQSQAAGTFRPVSGLRESQGRPRGQ